MSTWVVNIFRGMNTLSVLGLIAFLLLVCVGVVWIIVDAQRADREAR